VRQQINLYQPVFYQRRTQLSAGTATSLLGIVCVALSLWRIYGGQQEAQLEKDVQSAQAQEQQQAEFARIVGASQATRPNLIDLQAQAKRLGTELTERKRALALLRSGAAGTTVGFADRLEALARRRVEGVWLDRIVLGGAIGVSSLAGRTWDPTLVPRYLQALAAEPALRGTRFDEFDIGEPPAADTDSAGAADFKTPQKERTATRFRASSIAPPSTLARNGS
jgi:hypothetical protein